MIKKLNVNYMIKKIGCEKTYHNPYCNSSWQKINIWAFLIQLGLQKKAYFLLPKKNFDNYTIWGITTRITVL